MSDNWFWKPCSRSLTDSSGCKIFTDKVYVLSITKSNASEPPPCIRLTCTIPDEGTWVVSTGLLPTAASFTLVLWPVSLSLVPPRNAGKALLAAPGVELPLMRRAGPGETLFFEIVVLVTLGCWSLLSVILPLSENRLILFKLTINYSSTSNICICIPT